ncbi:Crp/Fnr family transcriptional regulator [Azospirillum sp. ST 5-10]|uniref:Crp/Fnr family transcriptional regulator n=1 Tax=unclassified Azospirillum TaxID=2630922 RepID=UPI003F49CF50
MSETAEHSMSPRPPPAAGGDTALLVRASAARDGPCGPCPVRAQGVCQGVPDHELDRLFGPARRILVRPAGATLFEQGGPFAHVLIVQSGWAVVYKLFEDGRRQVIRFAMPGDLLGFEGDERVGMLYTAEALTEVTLCTVRRGAFSRACREAPLLALNVARALAHEALAAWNHLGALGQQTAQERIANLLLDLHRRVSVQQGHREAAVHVPLNQVLIADATGLTSVHVCRTLKRMRAAGLLDFAKGSLHVLDGRRLEAIAQLDPDVALVGEVRAGAVQLGVAPVVGAGPGRPAG